MSERLSLSKDKIRVLLLEGVNDSAVELFRNAGYANLTRLPKALDGAELVAALQGVHILGIRSRTDLRAPILAAADRLIAVGCFSVGTNQVDLDAARVRGIPVFNAPFSNTRSVAELVIGEIVMLLRRIIPRTVAAHAGGWDKSAKDSLEVRGKTLGIVGYGNIGSQLSTLAEAMGMRVVYFDLTDKLRHGNTEPVDSLDALLGMSDVVSLHVPETA
ncbi:MAG: NAD(P)-dependent oxidoreductase, partial [Alsobacter sp.]